MSMSSPFHEGQRDISQDPQLREEDCPNEESFDDASDFHAFFASFPLDVD